MKDAAKILMHQQFAPRSPMWRCTAGLSGGYSARCLS